jgi:cell division protease FtsH
VLVDQPDRRGRLAILKVHARLATFDDGKSSLFLETGPSRVRGNYSEALARRIDDEVRRILETQHARVREVLGSREQELRHAVVQLLEKETLSGMELAVMAAEIGANSLLRQSTA